MIAGVTVSSCLDCGWSGMPERLWCPSCRGSRLRLVRTHVGTVEEVTIVRKGASRAGAPVRLGSVRIDSGGVLLARLEPGAVSGNRVRLLEDGGAAVARPLA